jgi:hypothetical protein
MSSTLVSRGQNVHFVVINYLYRCYQFINILAMPTRGIDPYQMAINILFPEETSGPQSEQRATPVPGHSLRSVQADGALSSAYVPFERVPDLRARDGARLLGDWRTLRSS